MDMQLRFLKVKTLLNNAYNKKSCKIDSGKFCIILLLETPFISLVFSGGGGGGGMGRRTLTCAHTQMYNVSMKRSPPKKNTGKKHRIKKIKNMTCLCQGIYYQFQINSKTNKK